MGWEGWELVLRQEVAVGDLVAKGRPWHPGHSADVVSIVTGHLHATEAGQAAGNLEDHALEARGPLAGGRPFPHSPAPSLATPGEQVARTPDCSLHVTPPGPQFPHLQNETDLTGAKETLRDLACALSDPNP